MRFRRSVKNGNDQPLNCRWPNENLPKKNSSGKIYLLQGHQLIERYQKFTIGAILSMKAI